MASRLDDAATKLTGVVTSFEAAGKIARTDLTDAAKSVGGSMDSAFKGVIDNIKSAIDGLSGGITALSAKLETQFQNTEKTAETLRTAAEQATTSALVRIDSKLQDFNSEATQRIQSLITALANQVSVLSHALSTAGEALQKHELNTREAAQNVAATAEAFGIVASDVRSATRPLADSSIKVADSAQIMSRAVADAALALTTGQEAAQQLASELKNHSERIKSFWDSYESRFANVDEQMAAAVKTLGEKLTEQQALISDFTVEIDKGFAKAVGNLNGAVTNFGEQAGEVRDAIEQFTKAVDARSIPG